MGKTTFRRDKDGNLIAYRDGKNMGRVGGMGDVPESKVRKAAKRKRK